MKPLVGITSGLRTEEFARVPFNRVDISVFYSNAVAVAGGTPVILPPLPGTEIDQLERLDAVIFSGGSDLDPSLYGDTAVHPETYGIDPARDTFELALGRLAFERDLPTIGICRGIQSLNVALGGTLIQHLPDRTKTSHRQGEIGVLAHDPCHSVTLAPDSLLATIYGTTTVEANSFHHQAVERVAPDFTPTAWSADGEIEGLEAPSRTCFFAVQWHPEMMFAHHDEQLAPFQRLIEIARSRQQINLNR